MKRLLVIILLLFIAGVHAIAQGHDNTSRCKFSKANVIRDSDPDCRVCKAEDVKVINDREKKEQDAKEAYKRKKALEDQEDQEEVRQEAEKQKLAEQKRNGTGTINIHATDGNRNEQTLKSQTNTGININSANTDVTYNRHMFDYRNAIKSGNYSAAQQALQNANAVKPVQNYQTMNQSLGVLKNAYDASYKYGNDQVAGEKAYNESIENGLQALGSMAEAIRANRQQRLKAESEEKERLWARKTQYYYDEKTKSTAGLMYENDELLQTCLIDAYHPPATLKEIFRLSYWNMFNLPQKITAGDKKIYAGNKQIKIVANGKKRVLYKDLAYPYLLASSNKELVLITYDADSVTGDRRSLVYDVRNDRPLTDWISVDFHGNGGDILGFSRDGSEFYYSRVGNVKKGKASQIVAYNIALGATRVITVGAGFWQATKLINGRYAVAREHYWNYYSITDVRTGETMYLPCSYTESICGVPVSDREEYLMLSFSGIDFLCLARFDDIKTYFSADFLNKCQKMKPDERIDLTLSILNEQIIPANKLKSLEALGSKDYKSTFPGFKTRVHTEQNGTAFKIFQSYSYSTNNAKAINSSETLFQYPNYIYYPFEGNYETHDIAFNDKLFLSINANTLNIKNPKAKLNKNFDLGYYPIKILDVQDDYFTVLGVDEYAFLVVKIYNLDVLYDKYGLN
jgi:hypothetical protein